MENGYEILLLRDVLDEAHEHRGALGAGRGAQCAAMRNRQTEPRLP